MIKVTGYSKAPASQNTLLVFASADEKGKITLHHVSSELKKTIAHLAEKEQFTAKENTFLSLYDTLGYTKVIVAGLKKNAAPFDGENVRRLAAAAFSHFSKATEVVVDLNALNEIAAFCGVAAPVFIKSLAEGFILKSYRFDVFKKKDEEKKVTLKEIAFVSTHQELSKLLAETKAICEGTFTARDLINLPSNHLNAEGLAEKAKQIAKAQKCKVQIFDKKKIEQLKMGGLLAVNKGSVNPPRFIVLEYLPPKSSKKLKKVLLVGKGVTFDTGGISIKPAAGMGEMKSDMSGAAAVLATIETVAKLKLGVHVIAVVPTTDNMPSGTSTNPGDVITMMNGLTVEVDNTDAEGRLILGDALHYGITTFQPDLTIDLATLTGACVIALGQWTAGMMTNDEVSALALKKAGEATSERVWPMPLFEEYADQLKSAPADVKNVGGRPAGAITAAKFLEKFVSGKPWIHLDIAGVAFMDAPIHYLPKEGAGYGVRLLTHYLKSIE
jgi:leucyl aminopeptidase